MNGNNRSPHARSSVIYNIDMRGMEIDAHNDIDVSGFFPAPHAQPKRSAGRGVASIVWQVCKILAWAVFYVLWIMLWKIPVLILKLICYALFMALLIALAPFMGRGMGRRGGGSRSPF